MNPTLRAAAIRGARTFTQAFAGYIGSKWIGTMVGGDIAISDLARAVQANADNAAGVAVLAAAIALGWNIRRPITPEPR